MGPAPHPVPVRRVSINGDEMTALQARAAKEVTQHRPKTGQPDTRKRKAMKSPYPTWFYMPAGAFYVVLFLVPTGASFYFALTRWTLFDQEFIGFDNFVRFFSEQALVQGFI